MDPMEKKRMILSLPAELHRAITEEAGMSGRSVNNLAWRILAERYGAVAPMEAVQREPPPRTPTASAPSFGEWVRSGADEYSQFLVAERVRAQDPGFPARGSREEIYTFLHAEGSPLSTHNLDCGWDHWRSTYFGDGFLYFLQDATSGLIQIGYSRDPERVCRGRGSGSRVLLQVVTGRGERSETRERFAHLRQNGDWFAPGEDLLEYVRGRSEAG